MKPAPRRIIRFIEGTILLWRSLFMQYARLGNTGLIVSRLAFGAMTFGTDSRFASVTKVDLTGARTLVNMCFEAGANFFDTADGYAHGQSETMLGELLRERRNDVV